MRNMRRNGVERDTVKLRHAYVKPEILKCERNYERESDYTSLREIEKKMKHAWEMQYEEGLSMCDSNSVMRNDNLVKIKKAEKV